MDKTIKKLQLPFFKLKKPYKEILVSDYDVLEIQGFDFPLMPFVNGKIEIKDNRTLKKPISISDMILKLELEHEITFSTTEKIDATDFLKYTNYYRLSIFIKYLRDDKSFTALKKIYEFDSFLSENIGRLITPLEVYIRTSLAHVLTTEYETIIRDLGKLGDDVSPALVYLDKRIYKDKVIDNKSMQETFSYIARDLYDRQKSELSLAHHISYYGGWIPFWVLVEHTTFGQLGMIIGFLERKVRKRWAEYTFPGNKVKEIVEWINTIRILRNTSAHCSRFYGRNFTYNPTLNNEDLKLICFEDEDDAYKASFKNTLFAGLITLRALYKQLREDDKLKWNRFILEIDSKISKDKNLSKSDLGFNDQWIDALNIKI
ncbi:Abi family protein [Listeria booriae]|uniref:Abi family protein n=1 Tax=Listeria booriae TaxID=1552123 RepID=UPI001629FC92|nr:Abi family protein [Listeria booriae]MBC2170645.1 Abi family protein [Listeria booriae]